MGLLTAEIRKLRTVRTTWVLTIIGLLWVGLMGASYVLESSFSGEFVGTVEQVATAVDAVGNASMFVLVVALLAMTTEFRHGTIGRTLQITPGRTRVLVSKMAGGAAYAVAFFVLGLLVMALLVGIRSMVAEVSLSFGAPVWTSIWQGSAALALTAVFGVAVGALVRSQVIAVTVTLVWVLVVENVVFGFWSHIGKWFPFTALTAVFTSDELMGGVEQPMFEMLDPAVGLSVFIGYVVVVAAAAGLLMRFRDV